MRYVVLSDIHANLEALEAVLEEIEGIEHDGVVCLGDIVGYGPDPGPVVELVRDRSAVTVRGNHDNAAIDRREEAFFNDWAAAAIRWTREQLSDGDQAYLGGLPYTATIGDALLVHSSPSKPEAWRYVLGTADATAEFDAFDERICLIGHSHVPMLVAKLEERVWELVLSEVSFTPGMRLIANVGSVGQPRDRDVRASFAVLDLDEGTLGIRRVAYNAEKTAGKIIDAGLPRFLGERLLVGQ